MNIYLREKKIPESVVKVVPFQDEESSKAYPKLVGTTVPKLAILKSNTTGSQTDQDSYIWLPQSVAIIEYLEDLCDAHPQLSPVPSLRGGNDLVRRALIRGSLGFMENTWATSGLINSFGSQAYNTLRNQNNLNMPAAHVAAKITQTMFLTPLDELLGRACDFAALEKGIEGAATIADIAIYTYLAFVRNVYGIHVSKGFPNIERLEATFEKRASSLCDLPKDGYPAWALPFRTGWLDRPWPVPDFDRIDARIIR